MESAQRQPLDALCYGVDSNSRIVCSSYPVQLLPVCPSLRRCFLLSVPTEVDAPCGLGVLEVTLSNCWQFRRVILAEFTACLACPVRRARNYGRVSFRPISCGGLLLVFCALRHHSIQFLLR